MGSRFPVSVGKWTRPRGTRRAGSARFFRRRFRGLQPRELKGDQRRRSATIIPDARPLRPISHWRTGWPPMLIVRMLKAQLLRQWYGLPLAQQPDAWTARFESPDALDRRAFW